MHIRADVYDDDDDEVCVCKLLMCGGSSKWHDVQLFINAQQFWNWHDYNSNEKKKYPKKPQWIILRIRQKVF